MTFRNYFKLRERNPACDKKRKDNKNKSKDPN